MASALTPLGIIETVARVSCILFVHKKHDSSTKGMAVGQ